MTILLLSNYVLSVMVELTRMDMKYVAKRGPIIPAKFDID